MNTNPVRRFGSTLGLLVIAATGSSHAATQAHDHSADAKSASSAFVTLVRESTERFRDVAVAEHEGYGLQFGCVSGPDYGAMGMHFVNFPLVLDGVLDPTRPEIVIYEPMPNGGLRLIGADYLVLADAWNATHSGPPHWAANCCTSSRRRTASACRPSTRCTYGRGKTIRPAHSSTGTRASRAMRSADRTHRPFTAVRRSPSFGSRWRSSVA